MNASTRFSRWSIAERGAGESFAAGKLVEMGASALLGAAVLVMAEWAAVGWLARNEFAGPWELWNALDQLVPLAWLVVAVAGVLGGAVLVLAGGPPRVGRASAALFGALFGAAVALGVSHGRHLAPPAVRSLFVVLVAAVACAATWALAPRVARMDRRTAALVAVVSALALELANRAILPRLYPAFHLGLAALVGMTAPLVGRGLVAVLGVAPATSQPAVRWGMGGAALALLVAALARAPSNARRLSLSDNVRFIFFDRAPLVGLGVELAGALAPPPPLEPVLAAEDVRHDGRLEIDWRDKDIVLISIDALRADHVGAYGYQRPTTPNIDELARGGTMFLRAYCPTPHTSYSVTSMMTGKNLRRLLAQGLGADSDTFAGLLRTYGYRTAAFYPPAVFFIDEELFAGFRDRRLDFEYARVEFGDPHERSRSVRSYLESQPRDHKVLLWVHLFEPHEPYVAHAEHPFGERDIDRYDSEIALADEGVGEIVRAVRETRPNAVFWVTADHGEEFGEHRGRYHGTTVYEEQVRVPLVVSGPGVAAGRRVEPPVQTVDLLPTVLAALDIPRPPRIWGRSLGQWLAPEAPAGATPKTPPPYAFSVTDDEAMLAEGEWRLVCAKRAAACALYNLDLDPGEARDASSSERERFASMKAALRRVEAAQGVYEASASKAAGAKAWPEPIRRGLAGDGDAAREVAALLDDSDVSFRRKAAELLFDLRRKETAPELRLALSRDEDDIVRRYCALTLTRLGEGAPRTVELLEDRDLSWKRLAALALAENGDAKGAGVLVAWWQTDRPAYLRAREVLAALAQIRAKEAAAPLIHSLDDVRLRPYLAETLAAIGDPAARGPLADRWAEERYQNARSALGAALVRLGAKRELVGPLVRFLGTPDPLPGGLDLARRGGVLDHVGGPASAELARLHAKASQGVLVKLVVPRGGNGSGRRVLVRARATDGRTGHVRVGARLAGLEPARHTTGSSEREGTDGEPVELDPRGAVDLAFDGRDEGATEVGALLPEELGVGDKDEIRLVVLASANVAIEALAVVPLADELPPPPPVPWKGPSEGAADAGTDEAH